MSAALFNDLRLLVSELFRYRTALISVFVVISFTVLGVGLVWPKVYESHVTIQVKEKDIIQPLLKGSAVSTSIAETSRNAKSLINSRKILVDVLTTIGSLDDTTSVSKKEQLLEKLKQSTEVVSVGHNLIKISFRNKNPDTAMIGAQRFAELFLENSKSRNNNESQAAFEFIDTQVKGYHAKLVDAEKNLKEFRSEHLDARPGSEAQVSDQLNRLQRQMEQSTIAYKEEKIKNKSLQRQLSGEAETVIGITREGQLRKRISDLQAELDTLRLSYQDTYPDVMQVRYQIEDLKNTLEKESVQKQKNRAAGTVTSKRALAENVSNNPLYQELRKALSESKTNLATLSTRITETKKLLNAEMARGKRIHGGEAALSELTRDYEVNRDIYQDLLKRRENARVSRNLESDQKGRMTLYEPAFLPVTPKGIRFMHFMLAGLLLGIMIPVGLFYMFQRADPRIRSVGVIRDNLGLPILAVMPVLATPYDTQQKNKNVRELGLVIVLTLALYAAIGILRFSGFI